MGPGTVHSVTTMKDCVAFGGHFYAAATLKYSIYSIYHTFVGSRTITNTAVDNEQLNLLRILLMWHEVMCEGTNRYLEDIESDPQRKSYSVMIFMGTEYSCRIDGAYSQCPPL